VSHITNYNLRERLPAVKVKGQISWYYVVTFVRRTNKTKHEWTP